MAFGACGILPWHDCITLPLISLSLLLTPISFIFSPTPLHLPLEKTKVDRSRYSRRGAILPLPNKVRSLLARIATFVDGEIWYPFHFLSLSFLFHSVVSTSNSSLFLFLLYLSSFWRDIKAGRGKFLDAQNILGTSTWEWIRYAISLYH